MKKLKGVRFFIEIILISALCWFTYLSFDKLFQEETKISHSYVNEGVELPSVSVCVKWLSMKGANASTLVDGRDLSLPNSENWTFSDYMGKTKLARDMINYAEFMDQLGDKQTMLAIIHQHMW